MNVDEIKKIGELMDKAALPAVPGLPELLSALVTIESVADLTTWTTIEHDILVRMTIALRGILSAKIEKRP